MAFLDRPWESPHPSAPTSFWEIFKHSWQVLWEKPKGLIIVLVALSLISMGFEELGLLLRVPFEPFFQALLESQGERDEAYRIFHDIANQEGYWRFILSFLVPFLITPFSALAMSKVALTLWDGYDVGLNDLGFSLKRYHYALFIVFVLSLVGLILAAAMMLCLVPTMLTKFLLTGSRAGVMFFGMFFSFIIVIYLFIRFVWPHFRRFVFVEFLVFFQMADGKVGIWAQRLFLVYHAIRFYPSHLNQAVGILVCTFIGLGIVTAVVIYVLAVIGLPQIVGAFFSQLLSFIVTLWMLVALAGFYRLVLAKPEEEEQKEEQEN
jgi:hypothetical protein